MNASLLSKEIEAPISQRRAFSMEADATTIDEGKRTVELSFSSEAPVERWWNRNIVEILDHSPESCDMARIGKRGPLLMDHDSRNQVGVVEKAWIDTATRKGKAVVRFSKSKAAQEIFQDVVDGIRSSVSVGYEIRGLRLEGEKDGVETYRITDWAPSEISLVSIPADTTVGVGRSNLNKHETRMHKILLAPTDTGGGGAAVVPDQSARTGNTGGASATANITIDHAAEARKAEQKRCSEIFELAKQHGDKAPASEVREFIEQGKSAAEFQAKILARYEQPKPVDFGKAFIGMDAKDISRYSITKAIRQLGNGEKLDGLEAEMSVEARKRYNRNSSGNFTIPTDVLHQSRALGSTTSSGGGFLVSDDMRPGDFVEILRNKSVLPMLGSRMIGGLTGNVEIPRQTGASTGYWVSEAASITNSDVALGQIRLVPHALAARGSWSKELVAQASLDVEALVRDDIAKVLALAKDLAALSGTGSAGQPIGILNTSGVGAVTYGGAPTWAKIVDQETTLAAANADAGTIGFAISPSTRGKWKTTVKVSGYPVYLMNDDGTVNGYKAAVSQQVAASTGLNHKSVYGDWSQLIVADWAGLDVTVDPYSLAANGQVQVVVIQWTDVAVRQPTAFVVSTDAANQ